MVTERQIKERELRKQNILDSALSVFKNKGFEGSTMDEIAKDADFGKATLYYYFNSKEEIFVEILNNGWKMIWESIEEEVHDHDQPKETFINSLNIIGGLVRKIKSYLNFFYCPQMMPTAFSDDKNSWKNYQNKMYGVFQSLLEEGIEKNEFPKMRSDIMMRAIGGLFHGLFFLGNDKKQMSRETMEEFISTFIGNYSSD
ncbi:hypothetical protein CM15mP37_02750 [bacterium]|nr:MAG: hypothetical protein CM15mP37_02750 [bacterium]